MELVGFISSSKILFPKDKEIFRKLEKVNNYFLQITQHGSIKEITPSELNELGEEFAQISNLIIHELEKDFLLYSKESKNN